jgi:uncharacterized protein (DUF697 family)
LTTSPLKERYAYTASKGDIMILSHLKHLMPNRDLRLKTIIHASAVEAGSVGLATAQIPGDRFIIGGVQVSMIIEIAAEFGESLTKSAALALFSSQIATVVGVEVANQVIKYVPGLGNISNAAVASSITETIGWATVNYYKKK